MDDRIKSAFEKAMERAGQVKEMSDSELARVENIPRGRMMAARFLKEKDYDLAADLAGQDPAVRPFLGEGARETFLLNIVLPLTDQEREANRRAMRGLTLTGGDRKVLGEALGEMEYLFDYYGKVLDSTYQRLKAGFGQRVDKARKKAEARLGHSVAIDVERQSAFIEEWGRTRAQITAQFEEKLNELKKMIRGKG